jgi:acyl-coenzyme A thioesterase PaaI-like protein
MRLQFVLLHDGSVQTVFPCNADFEGYPGFLHGGVISTLLDGAMTNCLYANATTGVTGELKVRFRHPVATGRNAVVRAWIHDKAPPLHVLKAELLQDEQVKANAVGKFMTISTMQTTRQRIGEMNDDQAIGDISRDLTNG